MLSSFEIKGGNTIDSIDSTNNYLEQSNNFGNNQGNKMAMQNLNLSRNDNKTQIVDKS